MIFSLNNTDKLYRGKSTKKLFPEKLNFERLVSPQNKKLFPLMTNQETNNKPETSSSKPVVRIDKKFGKPTTQSIIENDKKVLLPAEFKDKYQKKITKHKHSVSLYSAIYNRSGNILTTVQTETENKYLSPKRNYPYTKTSVQDLLVQKNDPINNQYTKKINENKFDILKQVPKYKWEY